MPTELYGIGTGMQQWLIGIALTLLAAAFLAAPDLLQRRRPSATEWTLVAFVAFGCLVTVTLHPAVLGRLTQTVWWAQALVLVVAVARLADRRLLMLTLHVYGVVAVAASVALLIQRALDADSRVLFIIHRNHFALLLILPTLFYLHRLIAHDPRERSLWAAGPLAALLPALLVTQSRAVWLGVAVATALLVAAQVGQTLAQASLRRVLGTLGILAIAIVGLLVFERIWTQLGHTSLFGVLETLAQPDEGSIGGRLRRWANAWLLVQEHWVVGIGLGNWGTVYESYRHLAVADATGDPSALNTYLLVAAETGVIGGLLLVAAVIGAVRNALREQLPAGLVAAMVAWLVALGFHSLYDFKIVLFGFAFLLGVLLWRAPDAAVRVDRAAWRLRTAAFVAVCLLLVMDAKYGLARIERDAIYETLWADHENGANRLLWRAMNKLSNVIKPPMNRAGIAGNHTRLEAANRYQPPDDRDFHVLLGDLHAANDRADLALAAYEQALARNPRNVAALMHACATATEPAAARRYCERGLQTNPALPGPHIALADLDQRAGASDTALGHLETARVLLRARLGENDFGLRSRDQVSRHYQIYRAISDRVLSLTATHGRSPERRLREIVETPLLHKSIAATGCHLYFSTNINARYNLWRHDLCDPDAPVALVTNDTRAPFRLRIAGGHLYFLSDRRGDNRFALYRLDLNTERTDPVTVPRGLLLEYSPSGDGRRLAVVVHRGGTFRLAVGDPATGEYRELLQSQRPFSEPVWHTEPDDAQRLLVIEGEARALAFDPVTGTQLEAIAPAPGGALAYTVRVGQQASELRLLSGDSSDRLLLGRRDSAIIDPVWLDADTLAFREVMNDEYLVRRLDIGTRDPQPAGLPSGVTYGLHRQSGSNELLFVAATDTIPAALFRLPDDSNRAEPILRLDWIAPDSVIPHERVVLNQSLDVTAYRFRPAQRGDAAIVWLHGGSSRFSPRWHSYAQFFAATGYEFVALNYRPVDGGGEERHVGAAEDLRDLVRSLRKEGYRRVYLIGVSTGTQIVQTYLGRDFDPVDGIVEYSPVNNPRWDEPRLLPPLISFTGANDPLIDHQRREAQHAAHRALGSTIEWVVYDGEGHDLRGQRVIEHHMARTWQFLTALDGSLRPGVKARVMEVPWLDQDAALTGLGNRAGLGGERLRPPPFVRMVLEPTILR
jgi:O-antigen ligase/dienelactone hydrolase